MSTKLAADNFIIVHRTIDASEKGARRLEKDIKTPSTRRCHENDFAVRSQKTPQGEQKRNVQLNVVDTVGADYCIERVFKTFVDSTFLFSEVDEGFLDMAVFTEGASMPVTSDVRSQYTDQLWIPVAELHGRTIRPSSAGHAWESETGPKLKYALVAQVPRAFRNKPCQNLSGGRQLAAKVPEEKSLSLRRPCNADARMILWRLIAKEAL